MSTCETDNLIASVEAKLGRVEGEISAEAHARAEARLGEAVEAQAEALLLLLARLALPRASVPGGATRAGSHAPGGADGREQIREEGAAVALALLLDLADPDPADFGRRFQVCAATGLQVDPRDLE